MRHAIFTVAAASLLGLACGGQSNEGGRLNRSVLPSTVDCKAGSATLEGKFVAPNRTTPVAGGEVAISTASGCKAGTDANGSFKFVNVPPGGASITAKKGVLTATASVTPGAAATLAINASDVKIAYVPGSFDNIQSVVQRLGFTATPLAASGLSSANLSQYQAVLLNCGCDESYATDGATKSKLTSFVNGGGVLYVSDWAYSYFQGAFPGHINFLSPDPQVGDPGKQTATVVDEALKLALGKPNATIDFNLPGWVVMDSTPSGDQLLSGPVTASGVNKGTRPYAAQFAIGQGRVTYTSFHNEAQTTADMDRLLEQMLLGL